MYAIDERTGELVGEFSTVIIDYVDGQFIRGFYSTKNLCDFAVNGLISVNGSLINEIVDKDFLMKHSIYSNMYGMYILSCNLSKKEILTHQYRKSIGFPYEFPKKYEAVESFNLFKNKQYLTSGEINFNISKYLKYTFGLEFETSTGIIPEEVCFRDGLIPLRDGSISGNEYSTVILSGNYGINLLYQQLKTLRKTTRFDKECSLHIHLGGFPLEPDKIYSLYALCYCIQEDLQKYVPEFTYYTARYKASGKDYCKRLPKISNFDRLYGFLTDRRYFGSLTQPHPNDVERKRKWQIHQRYFWANILNLVCYKVNKTMEFRLLRPTYNFHKILIWLYIFNAILQYAETKDVKVSDNITVLDILKEIYPEELYDKLETEVIKLQVLSEEQSLVGDRIGERIDIENEIFDPDETI